MKKLTVLLAVLLLLCAGAGCKKVKTVVITTPSAAETVRMENLYEILINAQEKDFGLVRIDDDGAADSLLPGLTQYGLKQRILASSPEGSEVLMAEADTAESAQNLEKMLRSRMDPESSNVFLTRRDAFVVYIDLNGGGILPSEVTSP